MTLRRAGWRVGEGRVRHEAREKAISHSSLAANTRKRDRELRVSRCRSGGAARIAERLVGNFGGVGWKGIPTQPRELQTQRDQQSGIIHEVAFPQASRLLAQPVRPLQSRMLRLSACGAV